MVDHVESKLASWKGRLLNKHGCLVLATVVLNSYGMQIHWYPQLVRDNLDRVSRRFVWNGFDDKGLYLVSWDKMTRHKKFGGLPV